MAQNEWADRPDPAEMRRNYAAVIELARQGGLRTPESGWAADRVLAHVLTVTETFEAVGAAVKRGERPDCGSPDVVDDDLLARRAAELGGVEGLSAQLETASARLVAHADSLTDADAAVTVRFIVFHDGRKIADEPRAWGKILAGHASFHLPLHVNQLRDLAVAERV
jgi:hypothetical protein